MERRGKEGWLMSSATSRVLEEILKVGEGRLERRITRTFYICDNFENPCAT